VPPSRRDWCLLPLIGLATVGLLLTTGELVARRIWYEKREFTCVVRDHPAFSLFRPNCTQTEKWFETAPIEETYNDCGYRTAEPCGRVAPGELRGVVLGTSIAAGYMVDYKQSFAALSTQSLKQACARPVDLQNLGIVSETGYLEPMMAERMRDVGRLKPDVIILVLSTFDFTHRMDPVMPAPSRPPPGGAVGFLLGARDWLEHYIQYRSHLFAVVRALAFHSSSFFLKSKLANQDDYGFMNAPNSAPWRRREAELDRLVGAVASEARSLPAPLLLMYVPSEPETRLAPGQTLVRHPQVLEDDLTLIARKYGATMVPVPDELRRHADAPDLYYHSDGHPAAGAHAIMAKVLTRSILSDAPSFHDCRAGTSEQSSPGERR
jgi:hypothetical protein